MPDPATDTREVAGRQVSIPRYPPCVRSVPFPEKVPHKPEQGPLPEVRQDQPNVEFRPASPYGYWWQLQRGAGPFWIDPTLGTTGSGAKSPPLYGRRAFGLPTNWQKCTKSARNFLLGGWGFPLQQVSYRLRCMFGRTWLYRSKVMLMLEWPRPSDTTFGLIPASI